MYIKQIELENFKCFKNIVIPFRSGLTVVSGTKGVGKSSILDSINFIYGKIENDLKLFNSDNFKLKVKVLFDNNNTIEKILEKDSSGNIKILHYLSEQYVSEKEVYNFLKELDLTIIDDCDINLSKKECVNLAKELKIKSKNEQIFVVAYKEEILIVADQLLSVISHEKLSGVKLT